jgi:urea transport system substrate-binding protein
MKIGLLFSLTGSRADMGSTIADGALLAVDELNEAGGVLGEPLDVEVMDTRSEISRAPGAVRTLMTERGANAIVGGYMSATRVAMLPVIRELNALLLYPTYFEGGESDPRVFYCGAAPNQYLPDYLRWISENIGRRVYILGSDYLYPRVLADAVTVTGPAWDMEVVGNQRVPLGERTFGPVTSDIQSSGADVVLCNLVGTDSTVAFYRAMSEQLPDTPVAATVTTGVDLRNMSSRVSDGRLMVASYLPDVPTPQNVAYRAALKRYRGPVPTHAAQVSAYNAVHMLALAAEHARSTDTDALRSALTQVSFNGNPAGVPFRFQQNHYSIHPAFLGRAHGGDYEVLAEFPPKLADPWWGTVRNEAVDSRNVSAR